MVYKIHEEADEIPLGDNQRDESLKELVDSLRQDFDFSVEQVQAEMARKKTEQRRLRQTLLH